VRGLAPYAPVMATKTERHQSQAVRINKQGQCTKGGGTDLVLVPPWGVTVSQTSHDPASSETCPWHALQQCHPGHMFLARGQQHVWVEGPIPRTSDRQHTHTHTHTTTTTTTTSTTHIHTTPHTTHTRTTPHHTHLGLGHWSRSHSSLMHSHRIYRLGLIDETTQVDDCQHPCVRPD